MKDEGLLSRWSRRKLQAERKKKQSARARPAQRTATEETSSGVPENRTRFENEETEGLPELSAEELARLPAVEELTGASEVTQFLRRGVPKALRNAALRRIWVLDPAIRDYLGEARDYAYDWNTPDGVPGSGPLLASDNVEAMLDRVMGDHETQPTREPEATQDLEERPTEIREVSPEIVPREASNEAAKCSEPANSPSGRGSATPA